MSAITERRLRRATTGGFAVVFALCSVWPAFAHCCCSDRDEPEAAERAEAPSCHETSPEPVNATSDSMRETACVCAPADASIAVEPELLVPIRTDCVATLVPREVELTHLKVIPSFVRVHQVERASQGPLTILHCSFLI